MTGIYEWNCPEGARRLKREFSHLGGDQLLSHFFELGVNPRVDSALLVMLVPHLAVRSLPLGLLLEPRAVSPGVEEGNA